MQSKRPVTRSNSTFYLACLAGITAAGIAACAYALSSTAATSSTLAATLGTQAALTATSAAAPALIPIIALTLLIGSLFLLPLMFSGNYALTTHQHGRRSYGWGFGDPTIVDSRRGYNPSFHQHGHANTYTIPIQTYGRDTHMHGHTTHVQGHDTHTHGHDTNSHTHQHR